MNKKFSVLFSMIVLTLTYGNCAMADEFEQLFTQKYKNEMLPELRLSKTDRYKANGMTEAQINSQLDKLADKAANCQFRTFQAYETRYQKLAFDALLAGGSTEEASIELNEALESDVNKGRLSATDVSGRVKKAMDLYATCVVNSGLVDN